MTARCFLPLVSLIATLAPGLFAATPIVIPAEGGKVTLPLTGMSVVLPAREKLSVKVSASWSLQADGKSFDGRDVLDEFTGPDNDTMISGSWVHIGYFNAGGPAEVVKEADLKDAWAVTAARLWGAEWQVRGGKWDFENTLGIRPTLVLACRQSAEGPALLLYHFFLRDEELSRDDMIARATESPTLRAVFEAYWNGQYGPSLPTRNEAVRMRGSTPASREVVLVKTGLRVQLPDDGFVWLARSDPPDASDFLDRMAPSLPDMCIEVAMVDASSVQEVITMLSGPNARQDPAPANLPGGWETVPSMKVSGGGWETVICKVIGTKAVIVGFICTPRIIDLGPYAPVLSALAEAGAKPRSESAK